MAKVYNRLQIDVNTRPSAVISAVQKDAKSRYLDVVLLDGAMALNLTGHEVRIYGKKADGKEFYNNGEITDATAGRCQFELTDQALAVAQDLQVQIILFKDNKEVLSTHAFTIHVVQSLFATNAIESSNEYGALVVLYQNLYEAYDLMTDMVKNMGAKGAISTARNMNTFWQGMEYLAKYMDTDLRQKLDSAIANASVQGVLNILGTTTNTGGTATSGTVMGKLNRLVSEGRLIVSHEGTAFSPVVEWRPDIKKSKTVMNGMNVGSKNVFVYEDKVYVADITTKKVFVFNATTLDKIGETAVQAGYSENIFVSGNVLYYADETAKKIISFNAATLAKIRETTTQEVWVRSMAVSGNTLYCTVVSVNKVFVFNATTLDKIGETAVQAGYSENIFVSGNVLYYADETAKKIISFNAATLAKIRETTTQDGEPYGVIVKENILYCSLMGAKKIIAFDATTLAKIRETATRPLQYTPTRYVIFNGMLCYEDTGEKTLVIHDERTLELVGDTGNLGDNITSLAVSMNEIIGIQAGKVVKLSNRYDITGYVKGVIR